MPVEERKCLFPQEAGRLALFDAYSHQNCMHECFIKKIMRHCQCLPWDHLRHRNLSNFRPCQASKLFCASRIMEASAGGNCDCPQDCNILRYSHSIQTLSWNASSFCFEAAQKTESIYGLQSAWRKMTSNSDNPFRDPDLKIDDPSAYEECLTAAKRGVNIRISYEDATVLRTTRLKRVTFVRMLSSLGASIFCKG